jgi:hypothetical protein
MLYAERLPALPSARTIVVPVVALVIGAAAATATYAVLDEDTSGSQATAPKVIVDPPAQPGAGVGAKNEAGVAAAIGNPAVSPQTGLKDEASTAAAIGQSNGGVELRGSKASESAALP